jgi:thiosulfate dehydrogenase [quinone] large subunit
MTTTTTSSTSSSTSTSIGRPAARAIVILPLRLFLGAAFVDAGLGKLLSAAYLGPGPQGFAAQARGFAHGSPIGWLVQAVALRHPAPAGLLLAVGELAVGLLTLVGLASRAAAGGGLAFSLTFFLTASWHTRPFFYGADLPFAAGWLVLLLAGDAGLPSLDRRLARRQRAQAGLGGDHEVAVPLGRLQQLCAAADPHGRCAGAAGRACRGQQCPLLPRPAGPVAFDASRRTVLARGGLAVVALGVTGVLGGAVAAAARVLAPETDSGGGLRSLPAPTTHPRAHQAAPSRTVPRGTRIGSLSDIPVGQAASFTTPSGKPAVAVRLGQRSVVAYSAVCTHAGCTVGYDAGARLLACPCHGAEFDPARGAAAVAGPTSTPLPKITLHVSPDGGVYLPPSG